MSYVNAPLKNRGIGNFKITTFGRLSGISNTKQNRIISVECNFSEKKMKQAKKLVTGGATTVTAVFYFSKSRMATL